jgi:hypothetical protein
MILEATDAFRARLDPVELHAVRVAEPRDFIVVGHTRGPVSVALLYHHGERVGQGEDPSPALAIAKALDDQTDSDR